jgi:hypothetical protein
MKHWLLLVLLATVVSAGVVTYPSRPAGSGPMSYTVVWNFDRDDVGDQSLASAPIYGYLERIVIESTGTDEAWGVTLKDAHGVSIFAKADLTSASVPYSYALSLADLAGNDFGAVPAHGPLTVETANVATTQEVQSLTLTANATDGTFTLTYKGQTTAAIAYNANAATTKAALEALSTVGTDDITVGGQPLNTTGATTFTFAAEIGDAPMLSVDLSSCGVTAEVQTLTSDDATEGTFTLSYGGDTTTDLAYNASTADIQAALLALDSLETGDVVVSGTTLAATGTTVFTFRASLGDVAMLTIDISDLTGPETATFAETTKGVLASGSFAQTTQGGADLTDITVTVYYRGNGG